MNYFNQLLALLFCLAISVNGSAIKNNEPINQPAFECPAPIGIYFYAAGPCLPYYYRCVDGNPNIEVKKQ